MARCYALARPPGTGGVRGPSGRLPTLIVVVTSGPPPSLGEISSLSELRHAVAALANYDGLYASFDGHGKRPVYRSRSILITGQARLRLVAAT